jgi:hypothetical protein
MKKTAAGTQKNTVKKKSLTTAAITKKPLPVNHIIPKTKGDEMIKRFRNSRKNLNKLTFSLGVEFDKSLFEKLLKLTDAKTVRIYNAANELNEHTFVITALNSKMQEIYFKIKPVAAASNSANMLKTSAVPVTTDGVGNMGSQCSEPVPKGGYSA